MVENHEVVHKSGNKLTEILKQMRRNTVTAAEEMQSSCDTRVGCLVAGIISSIISCLLVLGSIGLGIFLNLMLIAFGGDAREIFLLNLVLLVPLLVSIMDLSFSIVLAHGASKRKAGHLKSYCIYGNVKTLMLLIASIAMYVLLEDNLPPSITLFICEMKGMICLLLVNIILLICSLELATLSYNLLAGGLPYGLNTILTYMVFVTYKEMQSIPQGFSRLDNEIWVTQVQSKSIKI